MPSHPSSTVADPSGVPSKSQLKRQAQVLRTFGAQLVALPAGQLAKLPLDEPLQRAILEARQLKPRALRRQLNYIGKLLRAREITLLQQAVDPSEGYPGLDRERGHHHRYTPCPLAADGKIRCYRIRPPAAGRACR